MKVCLLGDLASNKDARSKIKTNYEVIKLEEIKTSDIVLVDPASSNDTIFFTNTDERLLLLKNGIPEKQIVDYSIFGNLAFFNPVAGFNEKYDSALFGMSHSECGINEQLIDGYACYKESSPSLDLFLHLRFLELLCKTHYAEIRKIRKYIFEMPYYIFNYDLSRFGDFALSKLNYFDIVSDYHHLPERTNFSEELEKYSIYKEICAEGFMAPADTPMRKESWIKTVYHALRNGLEIINNHDKVWCETYVETIEENKGYWEAILSLIREYSPKATVQVLVMPFNPLFKMTKRKEILKQKSIFYNNILVGEKSIIDDFEIKLPYSWYDDHCHISKRKTNEYTRLLNMRLKSWNS